MIEIATRLGRGAARETASIVHDTGRGQTTVAAVAAAGGMPSYASTKLTSLAWRCAAIVSVTTAGDRCERR